MHRPRPSATATYLNTAAIIAAAEITDAEAIHPGYGFLVRERRLRADGRGARLHLHRPAAEHIRIDGRQDRAPSRPAMSSGCPCVPGSDEAVGRRAPRRSRAAREIGFPVMIKAVAGGGGRGMRVVHTDAELNDAVRLDRATRRGSAFGNDQRLPREVPRAAAPHRDPDPRRQPRQRRPSGRARLLDAAAPPEDRRGGARPGPDPASARARSASARPTRAQARLPRRRHGRVPVENDEFYLHRDEHAASRSSTR